jgi:O-acetyl-ADP-ribose deacetylase (regulator of RNase III)
MEINYALMEEYINNNGNNCILCDSNNLDSSRDDTIVHVQCNNCKSTWNTIYKIHNVENLQIVSDKIVYVKGDATKPISFPCIIAHITNDQGGWGIGFTGAITRQFGTDPREHYKRIQRIQSTGTTRSGYCFIWEGHSVKIMHMVAQRGYRSLDNPHPLHLGDLDKCLSILYKQAKDFNLSVHMPKIGIDIGGGNWNEIEPIIEKYRNNIPTIIYEL